MKTVWLNLPVADLEKSKKFYKSIGFRPHPMHQDAQHLGGFIIGQNDFVLMLFPIQTFQQFTQNKVSDPRNGNQILINVDAETRQEVDQFAVRVQDAGGEIFAQPAEVDGWMYAMGFMDPDGHRWSMLYMDVSQMPDR